MNSYLKKAILLLFFLIINQSFSQTKEELINSIIEYDYVQLDYYNMSNKFGELLDIISEDELLKLTEHKNLIIRTYAKLGAIERGKGNIIDYLKGELEENTFIDVFDGCLGDHKTTSTIIYENYFWKKKQDTFKYYKNLQIKINDNKIDSIVTSSETFKKLDSTIIYSNGNVGTKVSKMVFNRKYNNKKIPRMEELAFKKNNFFALLYLIKANKKKYKPLASKYFINQFPTLKFESYHEKMNLIRYLDYLIYEGDLKLKKIGVDRLRKYEWVDHDYSFKIDMLIEDADIQGWEYYYPSGQLRAITTYRYGTKNYKRNGEFKYYHKNDKIYRTEMWDNDKLIQLSDCFDNNGNTLDKGTFNNGTGTVNEYNAKGELINITEYKAGKIIEKNVSLYAIWNDSDKLNSLAWKYYEEENNTNKLNLAIKWVQHSIYLDKNYYNTDTYAALLYKTGENKKALNVAKQAIEIAKVKGVDYRETKELIELINLKLK